MDKEEAKLNKVEGEVAIKKNFPALPPNYVSIAQLQERWLQRKQQEVERQKAQAESKNRDDVKPGKGFSETPQNSNNRDPRKAQQQQQQQEVERQKAQAESKNQDDPKPRKGFSETPQNSNSRDPRSEGHHVSDHQVYSRKGNEFDGFAGDIGMDKNVNVREIGEGNYKKKMHGVQKGRKGGGKEHGFWKIKEEKDCSRTQGGNRYCIAGVEGTASVFMVEAVCESVGEEVKPVELIRKSDGKMVKDRKNLRKNNDRRVKRSGRKSKVEELTENAMRKEDLGGKNAPLDGDDDDCMVEVLLENKGGDKEHGFWKIKEEKDCSQTQGKNRYCNAGVEGTASVFMAEAVRESVGEEVKPVELIRKSDGKMVNDRENLRKNDDRRVKRSGRKSKVEELTENAMREEDLGVLRGKNAPLNGDDDDCMVEVLLENKVKKGALLGSGRSKGSERFGGEIERKGKNKIDSKKSSDSEDKNTLVEAVEKGMEDEVQTGSNGSSLQKGRGRRKVQGYRHRESVSEDLETGITGNFRGLSFVDSKKSYVTSRMGGRGNYNKYTRYPVMEKPAVWVKKGEISATDVAEIDNSGPSKLESTGMDEDETEREKEAKSADLNRRS